MNSVQCVDSNEHTEIVSMNLVSSGNKSSKRCNCIFKRKCGQYLIDSGCTRHVTNDLSKMRHVEVLNNPVLCVTADGKSYYARKQGTIFYKTGNERTLILKDVLYCNSIADTLISVHSLAQDGFKLNFKDNLCSIRKHGLRIYSSFVPGIGNYVIHGTRTFNDGTRGDKWGFQEKPYHPYPRDPNEFSLTRTHESIHVFPDLYVEKNSKRKHKIKTVSYMKVLRTPTPTPTYSQRIHATYGHQNNRFLKKAGFKVFCDNHFYCITCSSSNTCRHSKKKKLPIITERIRGDKPLSVIHWDTTGKFSRAMNGDVWFTVGICDNTDFFIGLTAKYKDDINKKMQKATLKLEL